MLAPYSIAADLASTATGKGAALVGFIQSGTGAVSRTVQDKERETVSVKDFGAVGDGVTDDTSSLQAAITYASTSNRVLIVDDGNYLISSGLTSTGTLIMRARGKLGATLTTSSDITMFTGEVSKLYGIVFSHQGNSGSCVVVSGDKATIEDCYFSPSTSNTSTAVVLTGSNESVDRCGFTSRNSNAFCIDVMYTGSICINNRIFGCIMYGTGKGIRFSSSVSGGRPEGTSILDNKIILTGQEHILFNTCLSVSVIGNVIDQASLYAIHMSPSGPGIDGLMVQGNYIATASSPTTGNGMGISTGTGGVRGLSITGNMFSYCGYGVAVDSQVSMATIANNYFDVIDGISIKVEQSNNVTVSGNVLRGSVAHLSLVDGASGGPISVIGNQLDPAGSIVYTPTNTFNFNFEGNQGIKLSGPSTATVNVTTGTNTFVNVPHGLVSAPDAGKVRISTSLAGGALNNPTAIVSSIDSTNIVVNLFWSGIVTAGNIRVNAVASI